jgi:hypothetical protein
VSCPSRGSCHGRNLDGQLLALQRLLGKERTVIGSEACVRAVIASESWRRSETRIQLELLSITGCSFRLFGHLLLFLPPESYAHGHASLVNLPEVEPPFPSFTLIETRILPSGDAIGVVVSCKWQREGTLDSCFPNESSFLGTCSGRELGPLHVILHSRDNDTTSSNITPHFSSHL